MARKIEELLVELSADNRDLRRKLREAESAIEGVGAKAGGLGRRIAGGAAAGIAAIGALGGAAVGFGLKIAAETELAEQAFETLLGSAEEAKSFIGELRDFAAATPFEFAGVRSSAQQFLAMGFSAKEVIPLLTAVGDAVAVMGGGQEEIAGVTRALTQMQAKGKVTAEEMLQLAERGIPAWEFLAAKMGTDIPSAMAEVSKGAVSSAVFIEAFLESTAERFGGAMDKQSQTLVGLLSTFKDNMAVALAGAAEPLIAPLKEALPVITEVLGAVISEALPPLVEGIAAVLPVLSALAPALGAVAGLAGNLLGGLAPILTAVAEALVPVVEALLPIIEALLPVLLPLLELLAPLLLLVAEILKALTPAIEVVAKVLGVLVKAIVFLLKGALKPLTKGLEFLGKMWGNQARIVRGGFLGVIKRVAEGLQKLRDAIVGKVKAVLGWLKENWKKLLVAAIAGPLGIIVALIVKNWDEIKAKVAKGVTKAVDEVKDIGKRIALFIARGNAAVVDAVRDLWNRAKNRVAKGVTKAVDEVKDIGKRIALFIARGNAAVVDAVRDLWNRVIDFFSGVFDTAKQWGNDVIEGLMAGLKEMASKPVDFVKDLAGDLWNGFKDVLGIESPSRVFADMGENIANGVSSGIRRAGRGVRNAVAAVREALSGATDAVRDRASRAARAARDAVSRAGRAMADSGRRVVDRVRGFFRVRSPSALTEEIGRNIGLGLIKGVEGVDLSGIGRRLTNLGLPETARLAGRRGGGAGGVTIDVGGIHVTLPPGEGTAAGVRRGVAGALRETERRWATQVF